MNANSVKAKIVFFVVVVVPPEPRAVLGTW